ncbi:DUF11 domain-containing protein [Tahibacter amnicola]|uniref:DUF11 domain-containing protein n=1 Tax=Tahibacter amnicola TaxID=2976241 RepID=A0ABY6B7E2_9GAMM|nr:DUF11 domain-containing protein [Tahibacter amnicola]UXI65804.1 DUF11 domain-containing protein [Tahibacter amnicola]
MKKTRNARRTAAGATPRVARQQARLRFNPFRYAMLSAALVIAGIAPAVALDVPGAPVASGQMIHPDAAGKQTRPTVATDADGDTVSVWFEKPTTGRLLIQARLWDSAGLPRSAPITVNSTFVYGDQFPVVASDANGAFVVAWNTVGAWDSWSHIYLRRFDRNGVPLGPDERVDGPLSRDAGSVAVAMNASGAYAVVWQHYPGTGKPEIRLRRYAASGTPLDAEQLVATSTDSTFAAPQVAMDDAGNATVVWRDDLNDGAQGDVYLRRFTATGGSNPAIRLNYWNSGDQRDPQIAIDGAGNAVVLWYSSVYRNRPTIEGQAVDPNGNRVGWGFTAATTLSYPQEGPSKPAIAMARGTGEFVASWLRRDGDIYARRFAPDTTPRAEEVRVSDPLRDSHYPRLAADADGDFAVVWQDDPFAGSSTDLNSWMRRYAGNRSTDLRLNLTDVVDPVPAGEAVRYRVEVTNQSLPSPVAGVGVATGLIAAFAPPAGSSVIATVGTDWSCVTTTDVRCSYRQPLAPGFTAPALELTVTPPAGGGSLSATAVVSGNQYDAVSSNNGDSETTVLQ